MAEIKLDRVIAPAFYGLHQDIRSEGHTHYVLKGGRGSTKSSFTSIEIILGDHAAPRCTRSYPAQGREHAA